MKYVLRIKRTVNLTTVLRLKHLGSLKKRIKYVLLNHLQYPRLVVGHHDCDHAGVVADGGGDGGRGHGPVDAHGDEHDL